MIRREDKRIKKRLLANLSANGYEGLGLTSNISRHGMFIASPEIFPSTKEITIMLAAADDIFTIKGEVRWSIRSPFRFARNTPGGMGIRIIHAPEEYIRFVDHFHKPSASRTAQA